MDGNSNALNSIFGSSKNDRYPEESPLHGLYQDLLECLEPQKSMNSKPMVGFSNVLNIITSILSEPVANSQARQIETRNPQEEELVGDYVDTNENECESELSLLLGQSKSSKTLPSDSDKRILECGDVEKDDFAQLDVENVLKQFGMGDLMPKQVICELPAADVFNTVVDEEIDNSESNPKNWLDKSPLTIGGDMLTNLLNSFGFGNRPSYISSNLLNRSQTSAQQNDTRK